MYRGGYKDKTFCPYYKECKKGKECLSAKTDEIIKKANACGMDIWQFADIPNCFIHLKD